MKTKAARIKAARITDDPRDEASMEMPSAPSSYSVLAVSCACPLPGPCRCGATVE